MFSAFCSLWPGLSTISVAVRTAWDSTVSERFLPLSEVDPAISTLRRRRRKHPSLLQTRDGVEAIVPGLSTWTAEDLLEAGAWDEELAALADFEDSYPDESDRD